MKGEESRMKNEEKVYRWHQYLCFQGEGNKSEKEEKIRR
jgi:hypothetical protein